MRKPGRSISFPSISAAACLWLFMTMPQAQAAALLRPSGPDGPVATATLAIPSPADRAAGRGSPWMNLGDAIALTGGDPGLGVTLGSTDRRGLRPLTLASGDFDGDGIADLACGYGVPDGGLVRIYRGNPRSIFAHAEVDPEARGVPAGDPFLPSPRDLAQVGVLVLPFRASETRGRVQRPAGLRRRRSGVPRSKPVGSTQSGQFSGAVAVQQPSPRAMPRSLDRRD